MRFFPYLRLLMSATHKMPLVADTVYRGVREKDLSAKYAQDSKIIWWPFTSTCTSLKSIESFLGQKGPRTMFIIKCKAGISISSFSAIPDETEVLLMPASYLQVTSVIKQGDNGEFAIITLTQIKPPPLLDFPHPYLANAFS